MSASDFILIDGLYINKGGGAVLLQYLIEQVAASPAAGSFYFLLDPRFEKPACLTGNYTVIANKQTERYKFYRAKGGRFRKVFCFANTPPPVRLKCPVYTYMHNQKLLEAPKRWKERSWWKLYLKYLIIKAFNKNTDYYIVQTPHMVQEMAEVGLKDAAHCLSIPFYDNSKYAVASPPFADRRKNEFVFISNPSPQKNYPSLLDAWEYLLDQGRTPVLHVTIDHTAPHFEARVKALNERGAKIVNHVYVDPRELYFNCPFLIFPSIMESFGLPLLEAAESGMKIIASNLDFVFDVVEPSLVFEPYDKASIAAAVMMAMDSETGFPRVKAKNEIGKLMALLTE